MGAIWGSFAVTLVLRWPAGRTLAGRSACDACGTVLGARMLVPLLSYWVQRGRCRTCDAGIDPLHIWVEAAAAFYGVAAVLVLSGPAGAALALMGWLLLPLALLDARHFWVPDRLVIVLAAGGMLLGGWLMGTPFTHRLVGAVLLGGAMMALATAYRRWRGRDGMGGGDPKLAAAIALWLDPLALPLLLLLASAGGIVWAMLAPPPALVDDASDSESGTQAVPFGVLLAAAAIAVPLVWPLVIGF